MKNGNTLSSNSEPGSRRRALSGATDARRAPPARWLNPLFSVFIAGIVAYGAAFAWYGLRHFDKFDMLLYNFDDAWYYFQIASHMADGKFSTLDGGITRTNGYHPLWLFSITPFYWVFDKTTALFGIKVFEIMLIAGAAALVSGAAALTRQPWWLLFALCPALYSYRELFSGMECAAALCLLGLFFLSVCLHARNAARWTWLLTACAFALPWVRLEYIVVSLTCAVALWVVSERRGPLAAYHFGMPVLGAIAGLLVYFAYNYLAFRGIVPVSGATKAVQAQNIWAEAGGYDLARAVKETLSLGAFESGLPVAAEVGFYLLLVWRLAVRRPGDHAGRGLSIFLVCMGGLAALHVAQFVQVAVLQHPSRIASWYYAPTWLMVETVVPLRCFVAIYLIRRFFISRSSRLTNVLCTGVSLTGAVALLLTVDFTEPFKLVNYTSNPDSAAYRGFDNLQKRATWLKSMYGNSMIANRVLPEGSVIGGWDVGKFAYFSNFPVVNLDGLANSYDYLRTINSDENLNWRPGREPHKKSLYREFYRSFGITHIAKIYGERYDDASQLGSTLHIEPPLHGKGSFLGALEIRDDLDSAAWFWERISPHFDIHATDIGVAVDGRLAYAVARNCARDELLVWRWGNSPEESAVRPLNRTKTGLCTDMILLPNGVQSLVSVERRPPDA